jgi:Rad3-related DNA helicase
MWSLYEDGKSLKPLVFSNGKTQEDIVNEVIGAIRQGCRIIFIMGICGTGKSAIALNLAKEFGRASVVVPVKALQKQYEDDYTNKKYLLKENGQKLNIKVITGRSNYICPFLAENKEEQELVKSGKFERNSRLNEFGDVRRPAAEKTDDFSCDNSHLPCKIQIKEKNRDIIKKYLKKNPKLNLREFSSIFNVKRMSIAPVCPYWCPVVPAEIDLNLEAERRYYEGLSGIGYNIYQRKKGCGYYNQFDSYINADTIIFNSAKYKLETLMDRKPATDIEIIDECDEFLDSFSNQKEININKLNFALGSVFSKNNDVIDELMSLAKEIMKDRNIDAYAFNKKIMPLKETKIFDLLRLFLDSDFMKGVECDDENYCYHCDEVARIFKDFFDETYISFDKEEETVTARLVTTNLEKRFKELLDKNKIIVMMSGTIQSENVLKDIFGLQDFKIIEAETKMPGKITKLLTGSEFNCRYSNFKEKRVSREQYLKVLSKCIEKAKAPALIHVNSFNDLPTEEEAERYGLSIMTREKIVKMQSEDKEGETVKRFKEGKIDYLFSTKCNRGIDFPGETCNSIILTKYPYPNVSSLFWKILKLTKPQYYDEFYIDKAKREFLQRIFRGLRSENDHIYLLSPDIRVFKNLNF